jgi:hypothetical protein
MVFVLSQRGYAVCTALLIRIAEKRMMNASLSGSTLRIGRHGRRRIVPPLFLAQRLPAPAGARRRRALASGAADSAPRCYSFALCGGWRGRARMWLS